jgi:hypothetical protein
MATRLAMKKIIDEIEPRNAGGDNGQALAA